MAVIQNINKALNLIIDYSAPSQKYILYSQINCKLDNAIKASLQPKQRKKPMSSDGVILEADK